MAMAASSTPPSLPLFPLPHPIVLFPASRVTVPISKEAARALISLIQDSPTQPLIAAVPVLQSTPDTAGVIQDAAGGGVPSLLNEWGCAAQVVRLVRPSALQPSQPFLLTLQGVSRIRLQVPLPSLNTLDALHFTFHPIIYPPPNQPRAAPEHVDAFRIAGTRLLERLSKDAGPGPVVAAGTSKRDAYRRLRDTLEDVADDRTHVLADTLVSLVNADFADKLDMLSAVEPSARLQKAAAICTKQASISEVSSKITEAVHDSLSKQQKEYFLRQQLSAIQRELNNLHRTSGGGGGVPPNKRIGDGSSTGSSSELDDDEANEVEDMAEIRRKIEAMEIGSEERKIGVREWRRLKRIPQGSVEHGVIRNYLEWLTELPWSNNASITTESLDTLKDRNFVRKAREQLDADHFGLEKVKRRLVEYLAIVRLKALANAEEEQEAIAGESSSLAIVKRGDVDVPITKSLPPPPAQHTPTPAPVPSVKRPKRTTNKGPILLFVGPPGVGKTSLGQSVAKALRRPFQRISLGGVRDEAEIRGHRRTYVASGPGMIVQALRKAGRSDPVLLLDEVDKVGGANFHGDPAAALLEVLDPEQNWGFNDHYINVPIDLSQVLFICTSNSLDTISLPLLDRCEVIHLSGYTYSEKLHIGRRHLLPKQLSLNGFIRNHASSSSSSSLDVVVSTKNTSTNTDLSSPSSTTLLTIPDDTLTYIITRYTKEAGVRSLDRAIGSVVRFKAVERQDKIDEAAGARTGAQLQEYVPPGYDPLVSVSDLGKILGVERWIAEDEEQQHGREERRGVVYGLVVSGYGEGGILPVETIAVPGTGSLKLTGSLGEVIRESAELALSWVKRHSYALCVTSHPSQDPLKVPDPIDIHLHLPAGAQKKDGPSAGITMVCALVSLLTGATVPRGVAMTGEVTLRGMVTPVGGIKEKVLGAHRARITKVILPLGNRKDVEHDVPMDVRNQMEFVFASTVVEVLRAAFGPRGLEWRRGSELGVLPVETQSRL